MSPPQTSDYEEGELDGTGTYRIMALVRNPSAYTLGEASQLTGIATENLSSPSPKPRRRKRRRRRR
jgi:hypothetical protein